MTDSIKEALSEIARTAKNLEQTSSSRVVRDGHHFSFALPERTGRKPEPAPEKKKQ
jgi:hypothetical protein